MRPIFSVLATIYYFTPLRLKFEGAKLGKKPFATRAGPKKVGAWAIFPTLL
jgi:hypothetical protein